MQFLHLLVCFRIRQTAFCGGGGGAEFVGPENGRPKKNKDWKMQNLENDGPGYSKVLRVCVRMQKKVKKQVVTVRM